eukprot:TRINITY_DN2562_c0_g1_i1.p3 TRINITY_DN2562_c0_g1~~TRINITY_DN2562_c0_g1_i1.p3  ORF type:complete len:81 (-),score=8.99 TRINITY_DN2562_c0_g1_i1:12-254(-)
MVDLVEIGVGLPMEPKEAGPCYLGNTVYAGVPHPALVYIDYDTGIYVGMDTLDLSKESVGFNSFLVRQNIRPTPHGGGLP